MSSQIARLLIELSKDPFKSEQFLRSPKQFLDVEGLETAQCIALLSRNLNAIDQELVRAKSEENKPPRPPSEVIAQIEDDKPPHTHSEVIAQIEGNKPPRTASEVIAQIEEDKPPHTHSEVIAQIEGNKPPHLHNGPHTEAMTATIPDQPNEIKEGMLFVVGSGHSIAGQVTIESLSCIKQAQKVLYSCNGITEDWITEIRSDCEPLNDLYADGKDLHTTYGEMVERILRPVRAGLNVCVVFYGHPGVFVHAGHESIRQATREGHRARMLPGVSAHDVLIADLGVDPSSGCQMFDATDFLTRKRHYDPTCALVLWQVGAVGVHQHNASTENWNVQGVANLADFLGEVYSPDHKVVLYSASPLPTCKPVIHPLSISELPKAKINTASTLYVPPKGEPEWNMDMVGRLYKNKQ